MGLQRKQRVIVIILIFFPLLWEIDKIAKY